MRLLRIFATALVCLTASAFAADFPHQISYQGRVTDAGDVPITNPAANMQFRLFSVAAGGAAVWSESGVVVVSNGLFTHNLGSTCPGCFIPTSVFQNNDTLWLEVQYEAQVLSPRTMLVATPYAYRVATVDQSTGGTINGEVTVTGSSIANQLTVENNGLGRGGYFVMNHVLNTEPAVQGTHIGSGPGGSFFSEGGPGIVASSNVGTAATLSGDLQLGGDLLVLDGVDTVGQFDAAGNTLRNYGGDGNGENWRLWGSSFGQLQLYDASIGNVKEAELSGPSTGGSLTLNDPDGSEDKSLNAGATGDPSVVLGANAVNASEILNEAGVANNKFDDVIPTPSTDTVLASRTINCPSSGYVMVLGSGYLYANHSSGTQSRVDIWLTETENDRTGKPLAVYQLPSSVSTGEFQAPYALQGVFSVPSGNTTFYLQADNSSTGNYTSFLRSQLTLIFVPTAYGTIVSNAPMSDPNDPALKAYPGLSEPETATRIQAERLALDMAKMQQQLDELKAQLALSKEAN